MIGVGVTATSIAVLQRALGIVIPPVNDEESSFAYNLGFARHYSSNRPFLNLVKLAKYWTASNAASFTRDADFYPTEIPAGASHLYSDLFIDDSETGLLGQTIHIYWDGDATVELGDGGTVTTNEPNHIAYTPTSGLHRYEITSLGATGISNMRVLRDDHVALYNSGEVYNQQWLNIVSKAKMLRFLNWLTINGNNSDELWADRPVESRYSYLFRIPYEIVIDICNRAGADLWYQAPNRVGQDFAEGIAALVRDTLDTQLTCYVELSNETWNNSFDQALYYIAKGVEDWGTTGTGTVSFAEGDTAITGVGTAFTTEFSPAPILVAADGQLIEVNTITDDTNYVSSRLTRRAATNVPFAYDSEYKGTSSYVKYATQFAKWWQAVHPTRCKHLLGAQASASNGVQLLIDASDWQANEPGNWEARNVSFDGIAVATYYGLNVQTSAAIADLNAGAAVSEAEMLSRLDGYLRDGSVTSLPGLSARLRTHHRACRAAGLELYAYEGGSHILHPGGSETNAERNDLLAHFETWLGSDVCAAFHHDFLQMHKSFIDGPFMQFDAVSRWSNTTTWGAYQFPEQTTTDKRIDFLEGLSTAGRFWGADIEPQRTTVALPTITASEFETISTIRLDVCFTANAHTYSAVGLPAGLNIDAATGDISGVLEDGSAGSGTFTVTASNNTGSVEADVPFSITGVAAADPMDAAYNGIVYLDPSEASSITATSPPALDSIADRINGSPYDAAFYIPQTGVANLNGHNVITMNPSGGRLYGKDPRSVRDNVTDEFMIYTVFRRTNGSSNFSWVFAYGDDSDHFSLYAKNQNKILFNLTTDTGSYSVDVTPGGADSDWRLAKIKYDGANLLLDVNGVADSITATGTLTALHHAQTLGNSGENTNRLVGDLATLFIANRAYDTAEDGAMRSFFASKFNL